jgi:tRNA U34 5-carboxymethylaminomethyl modifying GTPase MnmE/TrmE
MAKHNWSDDTSAPSVMFKKLESDVRLALRKVNDRQLEPKYRKALAEIRQNLVDIRIYTNAYDFSEERGEQLDNAKLARKWLEQMHRHILKASEADIFSAIDVAHLTAQIDQITGDLI